MRLAVGTPVLPSIHRPCEKHSATGVLPPNRLDASKMPLRNRTDQSDA